MRFSQPRPIPLILFLGAFGTAIALGSWQVKRLQWKEELLTQITAAQEQPPLTTLPRAEAELKALQFRPVRLRGTWLHEIEYHLTPRYYAGKFGYWLVTPLQLNDKRIVLVNRGWVPGEKKDIGTRPETIAAGQATVSGLVRTGRERNYFTPKNAPDKNIWFGRDTDQMAAQYDLKNVIPAMVDKVGKQDINRLPVPSDGTIRLRNDHLSYIITWYGLALAILIIFLTYHRKKP